MVDTTRERALAMRWSGDDKAAFPYLARADELWRGWLDQYEPSREQLERKLLMDLYVDYEVSKHFGTDFRTTNRPEYDWFNHAALRPVLSGDDYRLRTADLERYRALMYETQRTGDFGRAIFEFIVDGRVDATP